MSIVPIMWDVGKETHLTQDEMTTFEKNDFLLSKKSKFPQEIYLVMMHLFISIDH
jgi:hypothetical protein